MTTFTTKQTDDYYLDIGWAQETTATYERMKGETLDALDELDEALADLSAAAIEARAELQAEIDQEEQNLKDIEDGQAYARKVLDAARKALGHV